MTDNKIYDIINNENNKTLFLYGLLLFFVIFIFKNKQFSSGLLIGLIIYIIIVNYSYTYNTENILNDKKKEEIKIENINTEYNEIKMYPEFVDFLFYLKPYESYNESLYLKITQLLNQFLILYENCILKNELINDYYITLLNLKIQILNRIENLSLMGAENLEEIKDNLQIILNKKLEELQLIHDKYIYYNGYDINTRNINSKQLTIQKDYKTENIRGYQVSDMVAVLAI